jgi:outer membrane protein assembly factor BamB
MITPHRPFGKMSSAIPALAIFALIAATMSQTAVAQQTRVKWRFRLDADYSLHRPAIGPDGTVYVNTSNGKLYALTPEGVQKWLIQVSDVPLGNLGPVAVGADGTVYVVAPTATNLALFAINPDGTKKWFFNQLGATLLAGPSLGPDGNLYGVTQPGGLGLFSLTPSGALRYSRAATWPQRGTLGTEIVFGPPDRLYFAIGYSTSKLFAFGLDGSPKFEVPADTFYATIQAAVGPNGNVVVSRFPTNIGLSLGAYNASGGLLWNFYEFPGNSQTYPDVSTDNTAYVVRNLSTLLALSPDGTVKWRYVDPGILFDPIVRPTNGLVLMGGQITYGQPGFIRAVGTEGKPLWKVDLPTEPGFGDYGQVLPISRPRFAANGNTAYIATDVAGDSASPNPYSYLYAIDTSGSSPPPPQPDTVAIQQAVYMRSKRQLQVGASSTNPSATLKVSVSSSGASIGTLVNNGGGRYSGLFAWPGNPQNVTVKSNLGGSASKAVVVK